MGEKVVLDTDVLIEAFEKGNEEIIEKIKEIAKNYILATTVINCIELLWGSKNLKETLEILDSLEILELDEDTAKFCGIIANRLRRKGETPPFADCAIAAVCIKKGAMLFTLNKKDFKRFEEFGLILI